MARSRSHCMYDLLNMQAWMASPWSYPIRFLQRSWWAAARRCKQVRDTYCENRRRVRPSSGMVTRIIKVRSVGSICVLTAALCLVASGTATAACPNEQIRLRETDALTLPDCRASGRSRPSKKNLVDANGRIWNCRRLSGWRSIDVQLEYSVPGKRWRFFVAILQERARRRRMVYRRSAAQDQPHLGSRSGGRDGRPCVHAYRSTRRRRRLRRWHKMPLS